MNDNEAIPSSSPPRRQPRNKGKLIGANRMRLKSGHGAMGPLTDLAASFKVRCEDARDKGCRTVTVHGKFRARTQMQKTRG
jgi:hypothetical protein